MKPRFQAPIIPENASFRCGARALWILAAGIAFAAACASSHEVSSNEVNNHGGATPDEGCPKNNPAYGTPCAMTTTKQCDYDCGERYRCSGGYWLWVTDPRLVSATGIPCAPIGRTCALAFDGCNDFWARCDAAGWAMLKYPNCFECGTPCPADPPAPGSQCKLCAPVDGSYECSYQAVTACGATKVGAKCTQAGLFAVSSDCPCGKATDEATCAKNPACGWKAGACVALM